MLFLKRKWETVSIVEKIRNHIKEMTRSEGLVAAYALEKARDVVYYTLEKTADKAGVSTTSVLRFCRKLGFSGYRDFQDALRRELKNHPDLEDKYMRTVEIPPEDGLFPETVNRTLLCIRESFQAISEEQISRAVEKISAANRVFTFGLREAGAMAHYGYSRFMTVRPNVFMLGAGFQGDVESVLSLTPGDVCVVYLFHRYTRQTRDILELLKERRIPVVLITSPPVDSLEALAQVVLPCQVDVGGIKNSFAAPVCLTDHLCGAVASARGEKALEHMKQAELLFKKNEILNE